jgi:RadC-like JAB domain
MSVSRIEEAGRWRYWGSSVWYPKASAVRESTTGELSEVSTCVQTSATPVPPQARPPCLTMSEQTVGYVGAEARWLEAQAVEHLVVFSLDAAGEIIGRQDFSDAAPKSCTVPMAVMVQEAQRQRAAGLLVLHNHPRRDQWSESLQRHWAGVCEPSAADRETTAALREALTAKGIALVDHVICGPRAMPYSFAEAARPVLSNDWDRRQRRLEVAGY